MFDTIAAEAQRQLNETFTAFGVDQGAVATSIRSTPATWTGVMDPIRKLYARSAG